MGSGRAVTHSKAEMSKTGEIIAEKRPTWRELAARPSTPPHIRRCRRCGVRYVLAMGFHRERKGRAGYRSTCKRCRNRLHAEWARSRYVPKTGRRYRTKAEREAQTS